MRRTVIVSGEPIEMHLSRTYKTVWIATGEYRGQRIRAKGRSEDNAVHAWRDVAKQLYATSSKDSGVQASFE
jgi:hypothetical protein